MSHAADRLFDRFGIVLGTREARDIFDAIKTDRCIRFGRDGRGNEYILVELLGARQMEVVKVVLAPDNYIVTVLVPKPHEEMQFRGIFPAAQRSEKEPAQGWLESWRQSVGLSRAVVAGAVGVTKDDLRRYEAGEPCPPDILIRLVAILEHDRTSNASRVIARARVVEASNQPRTVSA